MPAALALFLCIIFVLYLLQVERRKAGNVSYTLWVPTIWIMACAVKPLSIWFGPGQEVEGISDVEAGSPLDRGLLVALILAGTVTFWTRRKNWRAFKENNKWLIIIYVYALISIFWSEFTFISVKRYIRFTGTLIMALAVLSEREPRQAIESMLRRTAYVLIPFSLLLIKYYPNLGVMYGRWSGQRMWVGVAGQKNSFGMVCYVSAFFLFWALLRMWQERKGRGSKRVFYTDGLVFVIALYLLKGPPNAFSATSISVFVLGAGTLLGFLWLKSRQRKVGLPILITVLLLLFLYGFGAPFGARKIGAGFLELLGRDASFTDRDQIWEELVPIASQNPILGLGYGGFWVRPIESGVNHAHNGYLGVMLELGIVGVFLVLMFAISVCKAAYVSLTREFWWGALAYCFLLMIVLHNTTEASFLRTSDFLWTLLVFLGMVLPLAERKHAIRERQSLVELRPGLS